MNLRAVHKIEKDKTEKVMIGEFAYSLKFIYKDTQQTLIVKSVTKMLAT